MGKLTPTKALHKVYRQQSVKEETFIRFKKGLSNFLNQIQDCETEEKLKGDLMDFLKESYAPTYKVAPCGDIDCVIHLGNKSDTPIGVIIEAKKPGSQEMISCDNLNRKSFQELLLYYLRERIGNQNIQLKHLIVTNIYEYFIFDAHEFERLFFGNKELIKDFKEFSAGQKTGNTTDFFYKEIAAKHIAAIQEQIDYVYFDLRDYQKYLAPITDDNQRLLPLYKIFSPIHLLKLSLQGDSNSLNKNFYAELLYIMGLEEVYEKDKKGKRIIQRQSPSTRNEASLIENTINILDSEDRLRDVRNLSAYGNDRAEQLYNIALELSIHWINRLLFLKLLEAQMLKYHHGDRSFAFMAPERIADYDGLNRLFFQVLARRPAERSPSIREEYARVPYLNSSLFEVSALEHATVSISGLENKEIPLWTGTILKEKGIRSTLQYLLEFLNAYDFASEGQEQIEERPKTLINASVLGLIFEKINGHRDGAVFTPGAVTMFMCREAIRRVIVRKFNEFYHWDCDDYAALKNKDLTDLREANQIVDSIRLADPAVGSGHYLVSALNEIIATKFDLGILLDGQGFRIKKQNYHIEIENDELIVTDTDGEIFHYTPGHPESQRIQETLFREKRTVIENCLFGVDINPNSVHICCLRLWIELLKNAYYTSESGYTELETLPNIDINIKCGNSLLHRFDIEESMAAILSKTGISISDYRNAVASYKNAHTKDDKHTVLELITRIKSTLRHEIYIQDPLLKSLQNSRGELQKLQDPELFDSAYGSKRSKETAKKILKLKEKITQKERELEEIKLNRMYLGAFEWRIEFPEVLDDEGNFLGFDCIIGNPPYIQLQSMGKDSATLGKMKYKTYERTGDIYCLFYELGLQLLRPDGLLSFITSNKWMRAGYGASLRHFLTQHTNPIQLIDFAGTRIFDSATVDVNILSLLKQPNTYQTTSCAVDKSQICLDKLSDYFRANMTITEFKDNDSWVILSPIEQSIKRKIEEQGVPLKDWDINIYRGILTGYNEAFIVSGQKRAEILAACSTEEERARTAELIRPILRGKDIKRYTYNFANQWLINVHNGIKEKGVSRINIDDYPAIKAHLDQYWDKISIRADRGDTPYNLRNCAYMDDFNKQKIIYPDIMRLPQDMEKISHYPYIHLDSEGFFPEATLFIMTGERIQTIFHFLCSDIGFFAFSKFYMGPTFDNTGFRYKKEYIINLPIPDINFRQSEVVDDYETILIKKLQLSEQEVEYIRQYKFKLMTTR